MQMNFFYVIEHVLLQTVVIVLLMTGVFKYNEAEITKFIRKPVLAELCKYRLTESPEKKYLGI